MPYSLDFRKKVINFVENGGTITNAALDEIIRNYCAKECLILI